MFFCYFVIIPPPWKRVGPCIWTNLNLFTQGCIVPSLVEFGSMVLEKKMKMWKVYDNDNNNDDDGQRTSFDQKISLEPSALVSLKKSNHDIWVTLIEGFCLLSVLILQKVWRVPKYLVEFEFCKVWSSACLCELRRKMVNIIHNFHICLYPILWRI